MAAWYLHLLKARDGFGHSVEPSLDASETSGVLTYCPLLAGILRQGMGLPADDLCLENAVVLERFNLRFPLVVDPAGQATRFLLNKYQARYATNAPT